MVLQRQGPILLQVATVGRQSWISLWLQVCQYGNGTCGAFEALTQRGYLITDIANIGYVNASYTITVRNTAPALLFAVLS